MANTWSFKQVTGKRRELTLEGWSAPFGRPRKGAIYEEEFALRESKTHYGNRRVPSRHVFGDKLEPIVIKGRWMDVALGKGGANAKVIEWKQFIAEAQPVIIAWGDIASYHGLVTKLKIGREGPADVAWELTCELDEDLDLQKIRLIPTPNIQTIADEIAQDISSWSAFTTKPELIDTEDEEFVGQVTPQGIPKASIGELIRLFSGWVDDNLQTLVSNINQPFAALMTGIEEMETFENRTFASLERVLAGVMQTRTAILRARDLVATTQQDTLLFAANAEDDIRWARFEAEHDVKVSRSMDSLMQLWLEAKAAQELSPKRTVVAQQNDTWEKIADRVFLDADKADLLRQANGIEYGEAPRPGVAYTIPQDP